MDKTVVIEDDLTIEAAEGCGWGDVVITATAPVDTGHFAARKDHESLGIMFDCKGFIPEDSGVSVSPRLVRARVVEGSEARLAVSLPYQPFWVSTVWLSSLPFPLSCYA